MTPSDWGPPPRLVRWLLLAAVVPFAAVVLVRWADPPSATDGDYAQYLLHAKALVESRPYSDIGYIYTDMNLVGPGVQPPGWPLVLAPFVAAFGTHWPGFKLLVSLLVAAFGVTAGVYMSRRGETLTGIAVAMAAPIALETQYATGSALSDPLFCVLVWLTLLIADADKPSGWRRGVVLVLLSLAALSVRVAAVALIPALLLHAFLNRRNDRAKAIAPFAALLLLAAPLAYLGIDHIPFLRQTVENLPRLKLGEFWYVYRQAVSTGALYPFGSNLANDVYHALVAVPLVAGGVLFFRKEFKSVLACFAVAYAGVLLFSPVREARYAWPLIPLVMMWIVTGLSWMGNRFLTVSARPAVSRLILAFVAAVTIGAAVQLARTPARPALLDDADTVALFEWVRSTGDTTNIRVVFTNPRVLTLETNVPAMGIPFGDAEAVIAEFDRQHITHVVVPIRLATRESERWLLTFVSERPAQFPAVFSNGTHGVRRFVAHPPPATDSGALPVLRSQ